MNKINAAIQSIPIFLLTACSLTKQAGMSNSEWQKATKEVEVKYAHEVKDRLAPYFSSAQVAYPPNQVALLAFKEKKQIELWAANADKNWRHIRNYPLTAFSGISGPKLKRNDGQIPEGIYQITHFNPFSSQHLSLMLNYPNAFDKAQAKADGRYDLGDNIFIHGKEKSVGCLAIGDQAIDDIFVLVNKVGKENAQVIISPTDFRQNKAVVHTRNSPRWLPKLYQKLKNKLSRFT